MSKNAVAKSFCVDLSIGEEGMMVCEGNIPFAEIEPYEQWGKRGCQYGEGECLYIVEAEGRRYRYANYS